MTLFGQRERPSRAGVLTVSGGLASGKIEVTRKAGKRYYRWVVRASRPKTVPEDHKRIMVRMTASEHEQVKAFLKKIRKQ
jgi:hypothetical protein